MGKKEVKKQNNSLQRRLRATFLVGVMILLGVFFIGSVSAFTFTNGNVIMGVEDGSYMAYSYNGTNWLVNLTLNSSIPNLGGYVKPKVFFKDESWYLIKGDITGGLKGLVLLNNGTWIDNTTIVNGFANFAGMYGAPMIFQRNSQWYAIIGDNQFYGYALASNGTTWISNSTIIDGLASMTSITGGVFYKDESWYLIHGSTFENFTGYVLASNGTTWISNSTITAGFGNPTYAYNSPNIFKNGTFYYMLVGSYKGTGYYVAGYNWSYANTRWENNTLINASLAGGRFTNPTVFGFDSTGTSTPTVINISLISPANATTINTDGTDFSVNLSITGTNYSYSWVNNTYYIWFNNGTLANTTFVSGLSGNQTNFSRNIDSFIVGKTYLWNSYACYGNTTLSNCSWSLNGNWTFTYIPFTNDGEVYSASTYETKNETFYLNITTIPGASKMGAFLVYNGTFYAATHTCVGSACQVWRKIDIPLMTTSSLTSENKSFYWQITVFGTFGTSTSLTTTHNQNVSNLLFSNAGCVGGYNNSVNFTIYNETDRNLLDATFKGKFSYWLGDGTVKETYNFSGNGHNNYLFCINHNLSYITNSYITVNATNSRIYQLVKEIYTNTLKVQKLFIPDNSYSNIIIEVKNQGLVPQKDVSVNISRYYPETDTYEIVEHQTTDEYGQINAKLIQNDVKYKFNFFDASNNLLKTSDLVTVICRSSICVIPFVIETTTDYLEQYDNLTLFDYSLTFDNTTNIFSYSWDDQRGESSTHRLEVTRYAFNESTTVCNTTSTTTVSSLTCNVGSTPASYSVQTFRKVNGQTEIRITYLQIIVGDYSATFGIEGLFWVFILLFTCIGIGVYDPKVGAILYGVGFIFMGIIKIIYMPLPVFFANTILVILFVWAVKT